MEIYGTEGTFWLRTERGRLAHARAGSPDWITHDLPEAPLGRRHHQQWIDGLLGSAPRQTTGRDGLQSLLVVEALAHSAQRDSACVTVEAV
jgi:predicted dehydrogenase